MKRLRGMGVTQRLMVLGTPAVIAFAAVYILPLIFTGRYSLLSNSFERAFCGLENFRAVWGNPYFRLGMGHTLTLTLTLVASAMAVALAVGFLLYRRTRAMGMELLILVLPLFLPSASVCAVWRTAFHTSAFSDPLSAWAAIITLFVWKYAGVGAVLIRYGLDGVPRNVIQAAELDGAGRWRVNLEICLPIIKKQLMLVLLFFLMFAFRIYKECYLLFGEYPPEAMYLVQHYMNNQYLKLNFQYVSAAAMSFALLAAAFYGAAPLAAGRGRG